MLSRILFFIIWLLVVVNFFFGWAVWHILSGGERFSEKTSEFILNVAKAPSEFYHRLSSLESPKIPNNSFENGILFSKEKNVKNSLEFILLSTFNKENHLTELQLVNLRNGKLINHWRPDFGEIDLDKVSKSNTRIIHPQFFRGDIICNINNHLVRLNSNTSKFKWQTNSQFHHSIELDANQSIWACGTLPNSGNKNSIQNYIVDDAIFNVNPENGKVVYQKSIYSILSENGYSDMFYQFGITEKDPVHLNDIQPALQDGKYWNKGDLLISIRNKSTIFLYRPSRNKVIWLKTGPWLNQHDCDFLNNHQIGVFGNDVVRIQGKNVLVKNYNNQYIYDFETGGVTTPYSKMFQEGKIRTLTEGRSRILPNGDLYVEETNHGRILFGNKNGLYATYVSRIDDKHIAMLGWSRYYTKEELDKSTKLKK